jgi:hypothetical protein
MRVRISASLFAALAAASIAGCGKQPAPTGEPTPNGEPTQGAVRDEAGAPRDSSSTAASEKADTAAGGAPSAAADSVFAPLLDDVDRARSVQTTVDEQAERLRKEIEKAEGAGQ